MPYLHVPAGIAEEYDSDPEDLPGAVDPDKTVAGKGFDYYDGPEGLVQGESFDPATLDFEGDDMSGLVTKLRSLGYSDVRIQYDGGWDEGFAHFDAALAPDGTADDAATVAGRLTKGDGDLDELAHALAVSLLMEGYGTGEYEMFGAFTADLATGALTDLKDAEPHEHAVVHQSYDE
ncbi:hypothetical protein [Alienimonas chondri]|uniref:Uncharacterized protein n=1 Tax=Alienimonas chondri TaxID=2681879 RepID=A0ABX1VAF8_9PLAN|nr:hypothetical protein [Alienimonas chondri]NNJ24930.1 hypothetical protein [Alienimonas chondri]